MLGTTEKNRTEFQITAVEYNESIYESIEDGLNLQVPETSFLPNLLLVAQVNNLTCAPTTTDTPEGMILVIRISWTAPPGRDDSEATTSSTRPRTETGSLSPRS